MKKQIKYKPKSLTKEEQQYLDAMVKREIILSIIAIVLGVAMIVMLFAITKEVAGL